MSRYIVSGWRSIQVMLEVEADSTEEAVAKAMDGEYGHVDTEPGGDIWPNKWVAQKDQDQ